MLTIPIRSERSSCRARLASTRWVIWRQARLVSRLLAGELLAGIVLRAVVQMGLPRKVQALLANRPDRGRRLGISLVAHEDGPLAHRGRRVGRGHHVTRIGGKQPRNRMPLLPALDLATVRLAGREVVDVGKEVEELEPR